MAVLVLGDREVPQRLDPAQPGVAYIGLIAAAATVGSAAVIPGPAAVSDPARCKRLCLQRRMPVMYQPVLTAYLAAARAQVPVGVTPISGERPASASWPSAVGRCWPPAHAMTLR